MAKEDETPAKAHAGNARRKSKSSNNTPHGRKSLSKKQPNANDRKGKGSTTSSATKRTSSNNARSTPEYPPYESLSACQAAYADPSNTTLIRGKLRVLPSGQDSGSSFVTDDRGMYAKDIVVPDALARNRALDGDVVFVRLDEKPLPVGSKTSADSNKKFDEEEAGDEILMDWTNASNGSAGATELWQDDETQMALWNPVVPVARQAPKKMEQDPVQRQGSVVYVFPPAPLLSEIEPTQNSNKERTRPLVGYLKILPSGVALLTPLDKSLPQFKVPKSFQLTQDAVEDNKTLYRAEYVYGSWEETHQWPPCRQVQKMGQSCVLEDEIQALLMLNRVDHGEFPSQVLHNVDQAVQSGLCFENGKMEWRPTPQDYLGRRDYRKERIFTIDPTTAKDLDDALHIKELPDGRIEMGVHIADVSHFVTPQSPVDLEAQRRTTTVYLVDRTVPMLPRPLCEIACSLNENVERLAFSCIWTMNADGTLGKSPDIWYGRTVIRSVARLDYATAQNIIDGKVATGELPGEMDATLWPPSRRPNGQHHTVDQVAADVRLMHRVAMARRRLRFNNGALALNGPKLAFKLDADGQTPLLAEPYPIRDSNRLVEEFMLMANYLVAQRLITHAEGRALLRHHPEPLEEGLDQVAAVAKASVGFDLDISSSHSLHSSLQRFSRECQDDLVIQCVTQMLMNPMQPANYFAAGTMDSALWKHFGLNIPYYTHFTSPIRRYPDVLVHRLLQATLDADNDWKEFPLTEREIQMICEHCNEKRLAAKAAQERCDRVFLSLFVRSSPVQGQLGVVLSVGSSAFTVYIPSLGSTALLYLQEHQDVLTYQPQEDPDGQRVILLEEVSEGVKQWHRLEIRIFTKVRVTVACQDRPPIDIKARFEGPWLDTE